MSFYMHGLNAHELMPLTKIFKEPVVEQVEAVVPKEAIEEKPYYEGKGSHNQQRAVMQAYRSVKEQPQTPDVVRAEQIMSPSVVTLNPQSTVNEALGQFRTKKIRHLPVISLAGLLVGMVSDRDVLRYLGGVTESYQPQARHSRRERVVQLMQSPVLTASEDTDVRYIARLFVEQRVGALPIVSDGELKGIITRSDLLSAVMRHFVLELWV